MNNFNPLKFSASLLVSTFSILQTNVCFNFLINFNFIGFSELSVKISLKEKIFSGISVKLLSLTSPLIPWTPTKHPISINFFLLLPTTQHQNPLKM